jgi:AcrR family transcriptional regulator
MAKKPTPKPNRDTAKVIIDAAMKLAAERPWRGIALADIAAEAELGLVELYRIFPSKTAILKGFSSRIDAAVLDVPLAREDRPRDRLFDVLMRRFDALTPYKPALLAMGRDARKLRLDAMAIATHLPCSMAWMLEAAGVSAERLTGAVRVKVLSLVYLSTLRVFLDDESADLTRTMAALDRALRRAEPFLRLASSTDGQAAEGSAAATPG